MSNGNQCYTYRNGKKVDLVKRSDRFIVRRTPEAIDSMGLSGVEVEQVSGSSSRINCQPENLETLMAQTRQTAVSFHDYEMPDGSQEFLITDRIFVTFKDILSEEQVNDFASRYHLTKLETYSERDYLFELTTETGKNPVKLIVQLTENEDSVEIADHSLNYRATPHNFQLPTDPQYANQWHLRNDYNGKDAKLFDRRSSSRCEDAWQILQHYGCKDVVISITDDGCRLNHEDFNSTNKFAGWGYFQGRNLIKKGDAGADPNNMYQANENHGTSCAGVAAAEKDSKLTVGAAAGCRLLPIKWEIDKDRGYFLINDDKLLTALNYMADKVDIISNSWGSSPIGNWGNPVINRITQLAQNGGRRGKGIVFLWAAGNENCPISHQVNNRQPAVPYYDGWMKGEDGWFWYGFPIKPNTNPVEKYGASRSFEHNLVGIPGVMIIAALGSTAQRSHYSNYGKGISLCAPSSNKQLYTEKKLGLGITTDEGDSQKDVTATFGGTSSATPLTAGIAALVISANPNLTAIEVVSILQRTASKDLNFKGYDRTAPFPGAPDPKTWDVSPIAPFDKGTFHDRDPKKKLYPDGSWSPWFGYGRVDAAKAVTEALLPVTKDNVPNQYYRLVVEHSGKIIEVKDSSQEAGAVIQQNEWNGGNNQQWQFQDAGDGYYFIVNKNSNQIIAAHRDGSAFQYGKFNEEDDQKWKPVHASKDFFYLQNKHTGKVLGISESKQDNGTHAITWENLDIADQHWRLEALPIPDRDYRIVAQHSGKVLDLNDHYGTGFTVKQNSWTGRDDQKWQFQEAGDGYYLIINKPRLNQGPFKITSKNDTNVIYVYGTATYDDQKWKLEGIGAGFFYLSNKVTGKVIGIDNSKQDDGANAVPWEKVTGLADQHFKFEAV